ncbi:1-phosphofructokinase family hexose kinase [Pelagovum pacificum]|uniref:Phosphofructokinase n=1 Tax=Pelagovum pacificum TaxID=2588711 RepID=A0A5C5GEJ9_9RHOB|nr:1-phosphofructokinase family hexose kinase [Pelagovum pacificum]QQA43736.1 1-phosphofructokinase family hexose kinase [Pelagovum pacificum]TNY33133.1 1-phosphofructokinase family hexose kinase [Pelagovum pacificum]
MRDILTVTLNPALDLATSVAHAQPNVKLRCGPPDTDPGGGGLNVARAIHQLGGEARCFVALGGDTGQSLLNLLSRAGLNPVVHAAPGETRQSLAVTDLSTNDQFRFMLPGPEWESRDIAAVRQAILDAATGDGYLVLSGSGPSGAAPDLYARICHDFAGTSEEIILDTSGPALAHLAAGQEKPPFVLRMDQHEAEELARRPLASRRDSAIFARSLVQRGAARMVIVARGADGSVMAEADRLLHVSAAPVVVNSKVGAGDSFVGGFTMALASGEPVETALSWGAAAASAAVTTPGTQLCHRVDLDRLLPACVVSEL